MFVSVFCPAHLTLWLVIVYWPFFKESFTRGLTSKGVNFSLLKGFVRIKMAWKDYQPANQLKRELEFVLTHPHPFSGPSCKKVYA